MSYKEVKKVADLYSETLKDKNFVGMSKGQFFIYDLTNDRYKVISGAEAAVITGVPVEVMLGQMTIEEYQRLHAELPDPVEEPVLEPEPAPAPEPMTEPEPVQPEVPTVPEVPQTPTPAEPSDKERIKALEDKVAELDTFVHDRLK